MPVTRMNVRVEAEGTDWSLAQDRATLEKDHHKLVKVRGRSRRQQLSVRSGVEIVAHVNAGRRTR